jgi:hypothetical protein
MIDNPGDRTAAVTKVLVRLSGKLESFYCSFGDDTTRREGTGGRPLGT